MNINWAEVFVGGAAICGLILLGAYLMISACMRVGKYIADQRDKINEEIFDSMPDDFLVLAIENYEH
jgi:hypothetical protein